MNEPFKWYPYKLARKDGSSFLTCKDNGTSWEYNVVWWTEKDKAYPWETIIGPYYPELGFDYWCDFEGPYNL